MKNTLDPNYKNWLASIKEQIKSSQAKARLTVNTALINFYWDLGKMIFEKQTQSKWGDKLLNQLSDDLKKEFPDIKGLSSTNLKYTLNFYRFYINSKIGQQPVAQIHKNNSLIGQQAVDQFKNNEITLFQQPHIQLETYQLNKLPWGQNILIFTKCESIEIAQFYINQTIENNWSRETLALQLKSKLHERQGKSITNFKTTLPESQSKLAQETIKDPYVFDFLALSSSAKEQDIENQLIDNVAKFLLELGKGFAYIGKQQHIEVAKKDYYLDLLFYHVKLKCYVVIELKNTEFKPEYTGKLNFYLSAVDELVKEQSDNPTIGILLCRDKNNIEAEFALRNIKTPMGVSEFQFTEVLPDNFKSSLPTIEEIEEELSK